jgi:tetratricopeptide (TPR) repeat protein
MRVSELLLVFIVLAGALEDPLEKAQQFFDEGRFEEALEQAKTAEERFPGKIETWNLLGKIYLAEGASIQRFTGFAGLFRRDLLGEAEEAFRKALVIDAKSVDARNHLAFTLFLLKNIPAARDQIEKVLAIEPEESYANYLAGEIDLKMEEVTGAVERFEKALAVDPGFLDARAGLVRAYLQEGTLDEAANEVLELLRQMKDLPYTLVLAYEIYEARDLLNQAAALYRKMLDVAPERIDIRFQLGTVVFRLGDLEQADALLDTILEKEPDHTGAVYFKGAIRIRQNRLDEAAQLFMKAAGLEGDYMAQSLSQLHFIALRWAEERSPDACLDLMDFILECNPMDTDVMANRALTLARYGRQAEAGRAYQALMKMDPWDSEVVNNYALHLMGTGRMEEGLRMLEKAVDLDGNLDALENLGAYHYYTLGDDAKADAYFMRVLEIEPERSRSLILHERIVSRKSLGHD